MYEGPGDLRLKTKRQCTDVVCIAIFIVAAAAVAAIAVLVFQTGDPRRFMYGVDSWGNTCGHVNKEIPGVNLSGRNMLQRPFIYHFEPMSILKTSTKISTTLCVSSCPPKKIVTSQQLVEFGQENSPLCRYDVSVTTSNVAVLSGDQTCPELPIPAHVPIFNRCVGLFHEHFSGVINVVSKFVNNSVVSITPMQCQEERSFFETALYDLIESWRHIVALCIFSIAFSYVVVLLLGFIAHIFIIVIVASSIVGALLGTVTCWYFWYTNYTRLNQVPEDEQTDSDKSYLRRWLIYACLASVATVILVLIILVLRNKIQIAVQLFREVASAVTMMPALLFQPVWTLIFLAGGLSLFVYIYLYVTTSGEIVIAENTGFVSYQPMKGMDWMKALYILFVIWYVQFVFACQQMIIAGAVVFWYFTRNKYQLGFPVVRSLTQLVRYHLGSVLFGSLLLALVNFAQGILHYLQKKLSRSPSKFAKFMLKCLQCLLWCFEKFLKFINKRAYIVVAMHGTNFCRSAQKAFALIVANIVRLSVVNMLAMFCLFMAKIGIVCGVVALAIRMHRSSSICYVFIPVVVSGLAAYIIADCFFSVYSMALDTLFLCFCEDVSQNDGIKNPYFMRKRLMMFVENANTVKKFNSDEARSRRRSLRDPDDDDTPPPKNRRSSHSSSKPDDGDAEPNR